ncbi:MAG: Nif3-like dinuclear metal center hexameric protein [Peptostreptococcales bacterium]|jgi:dinuclear metal center YbgI/SA1388 family protein
MKLNHIIEQIEQISPEVDAENWDNGGIQIYMDHDDVTKVLIALEITDEVIKEAIQNNIHLIITHHPLLFQPLQSIDEDWISQSVVKLIQNKIAVYSSHTSFDALSGGNNDYLAALLELRLIDKVEFRDDDSEKSRLLRIGEFSKTMTLEEACIQLKEKLDIKHPMSYVGQKTTEIKRVAICTGSGADFIEEASKKDCDLLITGDVKYHDAQEAIQAGIALIDGTHFHTEKIFIENMYEKLIQKIGSEVIVLKSNCAVNPFQYI